MEVCFVCEDNDLRLSEPYEKKRSIEDQLLCLLVNYYNSHYSHNPDSDMAKKLEQRIDRLKMHPIIHEYFECVSEINSLLEDKIVTENGIDYKVVDVSTRRFMKIKYVK